MWIIDHTPHLIVDWLLLTTAAHVLLILYKLFVQEK